MNRRGFLRGVAGFFAAPAIVHVSSIMPIKLIDWGSHGGVVSTESLYEEITRFTRQAFVRRWDGDSYMISPLTRMMLKVDL